MKLSKKNNWWFNCYFTKKELNVHPFNKKFEGKKRNNYKNGKLPKLLGIKTSLCRVIAFYCFFFFFEKCIKNTLLT